MTNAANISATEHWLDGTGGRIFARHFEPGGPAKANLVICHGVNSHGGQYVRAGEALAQRGFAVTALDLRGRGKSDGERYYVESIDDYVSDLSLTIEAARSGHPDLPLYLLGHSAGGVVSCSYALDHQDRLSGLICESFAFQVYAPDFALKLVEGASHVIPHVHALTLKNEDFSRDPDWVAQLNADPLIQKESQPVATVAALARADERLKREFGRITLPLLILHGTADKATRPEGSQLFFDEAGSADKALKLYEGHVHDLLNDIGREQVLDDIVAWIEARLPQGEHPRMQVPPIPA
ncbi:alpha/beta hydrolase [Sphingosinicella rhizophila]|uniref:Alpha/beta hydrolase n=1 Tax=Sphingosinicella rhizophila TaxID=3050082 RepID=A0ABU3QAR7_9SPHN|nr:lysophospholipase [Sphingosinicella sp. GR2756]MDT9600040.1 alpha/beta hydrolase [Sphingosinicella sp. GR2756]